MLKNYLLDKLKFSTANYYNKLIDVQKFKLNQ